LAFLDELLYANYRQQRTDSQLLDELKAEFKKERNFQPIWKYRYYFNTALPQHRMGIGRPLNTREELPEFGVGPSCTPVGTQTPPPRLLLRKSSQAAKSSTAKKQGPSRSRSNKPNRGNTSSFGGVTAIEGQKTEVVKLVSKRHRGLRDRALREAKGHCCVCGTDFSQLLDGRGVRVLQVHHRDQLAASDIPRETKLSDLAVVCANCHILLHFNPRRATRVETLQRKLRRVQK
jgi:5-methylcytosine-specific restriction endonuclease McrA